MNVIFFIFVQHVDGVLSTRTCFVSPIRRRIVYCLSRATRRTYVSRRRRRRSTERVFLITFYYAVRPFAYPSIRSVRRIYWTASYRKGIFVFHAENFPSRSQIYIRVSIISPLVDCINWNEKYKRRPIITRRNICSFTSIANGIFIARMRAIMLAFFNY